MMKSDVWQRKTLRKRHLRPRKYRSVNLFWNVYLRFLWLPTKPMSCGIKRPFHLLLLQSFRRCTIHMDGRPISTRLKYLISSELCASWPDYSEWSTWCCFSIWTRCHWSGHSDSVGWIWHFRFADYPFFCSVGTEEIKIITLWGVLKTNISYL